MAVTIDGTLGVTTPTGTGDVSVGDDLIFTGTGNRITGDFSNTTVANRVMFQTSTVNGGASVGVVPNGTGTFGQFSAYSASDPGNSSVANVSAISGSDVRIVSGLLGTGTYLPMTFYAGGSERVRIDTSGNVGIGVAPYDSNTGLTVYRSQNNLFYQDIQNPNTGSSAGAMLRLISSNVAGSGTTSADIVKYKTGALFINNNETNSAAYTGFAVSGSERMRIDSSGNVGIGTSSPSSIAGYTTLTLNNATNGGNIVLQTNGTTIGSVYAANSVLSIYGNTGVPIVFQAGGTERARIDSSGNLLVGTTSPGSGSSTGLTIGSGRYIWNVGAYNFTTATGANLVVQSDGIFQRSSSAAKYKQDIRDLETVDISNFRPVRYKSKCEGDDQTKDYFGIVADEVAEAGVEELVTRGADGEIEGFQYDRFTVVLLKAIQEQQAIIQSLQDRITALEQA